MDSVIIEEESVGNAKQLVVQVIASEDDDAEDLDKVTRLLRSELLSLGLDAVDPLAESDLPAGAKGIGELAGWILIQFSSPDLVQAVMTAIADWSGRAKRTVKVSFGQDVLEVSNATPAQQEKIIEAWLERHSASA